MNLTGLRRSDVASENPLLKETDARSPQLAAGKLANFDWLKSTDYRDGVLLLGGEVLMTARVDAITNSSARVERNGLEAVPLDKSSHYGDPTQYPNIAIL